MQAKILQLEAQVSEYTQPKPSSEEVVLLQEEKAHIEQQISEVTKNWNDAKKRYENKYKKSNRDFSA